MANINSEQVMNQNTGTTQTEYLLNVSEDDIVKCDQLSIESAILYAKNILCGRLEMMICIELIHMLTDLPLDKMAAISLTIF